MSKELSFENGEVVDAGDMVECVNCGAELTADLAWMFTTDLGCPECHE